MDQEWIVWGSELSPFALKLRALCRFKGLKHRFLPADDGFVEALRYECRRRLLVAGLLKLTAPKMTTLDEFPLVPYLFGPNGENLYESTAIAHWLDSTLDTPAIVPTDPVKAFVVCLIDDFFDEWGLYLVHHNRWKVAALENDAGQRLGEEQKALFLPAMRRRFGRWFAARQTRRLPYLFSVAPEGFKIDGVIAERQPRSRDGFPATHQLLEDSFDRILQAIEPIFRHRSSLLGDGFTLADASLYGQLGMNLADSEIAHQLEVKAPATHAWLSQIHSGNLPDGEPKPASIPADLKPLLTEIARVYFPLMQQNETAYQRISGNAKAQFNERAFWKNQSLYQGELDGHPYKAVVKTFQVASWRVVCETWRGLNPEQRQAVLELLPSGSTDAFGKV